MPVVMRASIFLTLFCILILEAIMEELMSLRDRCLAHSSAKQSHEKKITINEETAMGDCTFRLRTALKSISTGFLCEEDVQLLPRDGADDQCTN